jgi:uncharacterized protein (UPF0333 family)
MTKPSKQAIETVKTVVIAVLVTSIVAFVAGMRYQANVHSSTEAKVSQAVAQASPKE